jgi:hypothetical protein
MKCVMADRPYNSCLHCEGHLESLQNPFRHLGADDIVSVGGDSISIELGHCSFTDIMQQRRPDQIRITIGRACFHGHSRVCGHISFHMVLRRLGGLGKLFEFRNESNDAFPPAGYSSLKLFFDHLIWFNHMLLSGCPFWVRVIPDYTPLFSKLPE